MFRFAIVTGIYSYIIFLLGILQFLSYNTLLFATVFYSFFIFLVVKPYFLDKKFRLNISSKTGKLDKLSILIVILILLQISVNLIGAMGPELAFDALWYHLTIPKIYLEQHKIFYIGGHLYYSAMPKLVEMYYMVGLALGNEIVAKLIHFSFGILTLVALYQLSRKFLDLKDSLLVVLIFSSNLVAAWLSMTAYIDLARTFFELLALWAFLNFLQTHKFNWVAMSALMVGLAIGTKLLSLGSVGIYLLLFFYLWIQKRITYPELYKYSIMSIFIVGIVISPWIIFSYMTTGSPVYPFFSPGFQNVSNVNLFDLPGFFVKAFKTFMLSPDPISPIYFISIPLIILFVWKNFFRRQLNKTDLTINVLIIYVFGGLCITYIGPVESTGRFMLPYLPGFSILFILLINRLRTKLIYNFLIVVIIVIAISSIGYRGVANKRFIPYVLGQTTKTQFMVNNLEFNVGNFYDIDGYFAKTIKPADKVLIYGISNLYYIDFPYIHESWAKKGDRFNYILVKNMGLPERFKDWNLVYENDITRVKLYSLISGHELVK